MSKYDETWINTLKSHIPGTVTTEDRRLYRPGYPRQYVHFITETPTGKLFVQACKNFDDPSLANATIETWDRNNNSPRETMAYVVNLSSIDTEEDNTIMFCGMHGTVLEIDRDGRVLMQSKGYRLLEGATQTPIVTSKEPYTGEWIERMATHFGFHYEINPAKPTYEDESLSHQELFDGRIKREAICQSAFTSHVLINQIQ